MEALQTRAVNRNTARRDKHRKIVARGRPPCHLCGNEIDYAASHLEPHSYTIHHVIPLAKGGPDQMHLEDGTPQIVAAHRKCNRDYGDGGDNIKPLVAFVTSRNW